MLSAFGSPMRPCVFPPAPSGPMFRLANVSVTATTISGRFEAQATAGVWGAFCATGFDATASHISCGLLGLTGGSVASSSAFGISGGQSIGTVSCPASCASLDCCSLTSTVLCAPYAEAAVTCTIPTGLQIAPAPPAVSSPSQGAPMLVNDSKSDFRLIRVYRVGGRSQISPKTPFPCRGFQQ